MISGVVNENLFVIFIPKVQVPSRGGEKRFEAKAYDCGRSLAAGGMIIAVTGRLLHAGLLLGFECSMRSLDQLSFKLKAR